MQIAPIAAATNHTVTMIPRLSSDVVSPSRLFELGRFRLMHAVGMLRGGQEDSAPNSFTTALVIRQVDMGVTTLGSVLVPSTSFELRTRATNAIDQGRAALDLLRDYHRLVVPFGSGPLQRDALPPATSSILDHAIDRLVAAMASTTK